VSARKAILDQKSVRIVRRAVESAFAAVAQTPRVLTAKGWDRPSGTESHVDHRGGPRGAGRERNVGGVVENHSHEEAFQTPEFLVSRTTTTVLDDRCAAYRSRSSGDLLKSRHLAHSRSRSAPTAARARTTREPSFNSTGASGSHGAARAVR
jgi:hypothetical protein